MVELYLQWAKAPCQKSSPADVCSPRSLIKWASKKTIQIHFLATVTLSFCVVSLKEYQQGGKVAPKLPQRVHRQSQSDLDFAQLDQATYSSWEDCSTSLYPVILQPPSNITHSECVNFPHFCSHAHLRKFIVQSSVARVQSVLHNTVNQILFFWLDIYWIWTKVTYMYVVQWAHGHVPHWSASWLVLKWLALKWHERIIYF